MQPIPQDFARALKNAGLGNFFTASAPSHRQEYLKWITEAKRPETRKSRIQKALEMLSEKRSSR